jgi:hypothetical protein
MQDYATIAQPARSRRSFDAMMAERNWDPRHPDNGLSQPAMSKALNRRRHLLDDRIFELHLRGFARR